MPFTFVHPAAVLPLAGRTGRYLSLIGLLLGSTMPDFEYFARVQMGSIYGHTWLGLLIWNLPVGLLVAWVYLRWVHTSLVYHMPAAIAQRVGAWLRPAVPASLTGWMVLAYSIIIGAATHIAWDSFTHGGHMTGQVIPALSQEITLGGFTFPRYKILQQISTLIGGIALLAFVWRLPKVDSIASASRSSLIRYWSIVVASAVTMLTIKFYMGLTLIEYGTVAVSIISGGLIGLLIASLLLPNRDKSPS